MQRWLVAHMVVTFALGVSACGSEETVEDAALDAGSSDAGQDAAHSDGGIDAAAFDAGSDAAEGAVDAEVPSDAGADADADVADGGNACEGVGVECTAHGTCVLEDGGARCQCDPPYANGADPLSCFACVAGHHRELGACVPDVTCGPTSCGPGTCDDSMGFIACSCPANFLPGFCTACEDGYHREGDACVEDVPCAPDSCNGNGACDDASGVPMCLCVPEYGGDRCDVCAAGHEVNPISGRCELPCAANEFRCGGVCVDATSDANCGACGNACGADALCSPTLLTCNVCGDVQYDELNCGACGNACDGDEKCIRGICMTDTDMTCAGGCAEFELCCLGRCVFDGELLTDGSNCGGCGITCGAEEVCANGACVAGDASCAGCFSDQVCCDVGGSATCTSPQSDESHCGGCGLACEGAEVCQLGRCSCNDTLCGLPDGSTICADLETDPTNCGGCGIACAVGERCAGGECYAPNGTCAPDCADAQICCDDPDTPAADGVCVLTASLDVNDDHCGACSNRCDPAATCVDGSCSCAPDGVNVTECGGVCTDLSSPTSCGACGVSCTGAEVCRFGGVGVYACECPTTGGLYTDCGGTCTALGTTSDCRSCGDACVGAEVCSAEGCCLPSGESDGGDPSACCSGSSAGGICEPAQCVSQANTRCVIGSHTCCSGDCINVGAGLDVCCLPDGTQHTRFGGEARCCNPDLDGNGYCGDQPDPACSEVDELCASDDGCCTGSCDAAGTGRCCFPDGTPSWDEARDGVLDYCCTPDVDFNMICGDQSGECRSIGDACFLASECCEGTCRDGSCCQGYGSVVPAGSDAATYCCDGDPDANGICGDQRCGMPGESCPVAGCCGGSCLGGVCCYPDDTTPSDVAQCCNGDEDMDGVCGRQSCTALGDRCSGTAECCAGTCEMNACCLGNGEASAQASDCCSGSVSGGSCCVANGPASSSAECCPGAVYNPFLGGVCATI